MKTLRRLLCISLIAGTCSTNAFAALMISAASTTPIPSLPVDWSNILSFPKFNSALGTLIKFQLDLTSTLNTTLTITNASASVSNGTAKTELLLSVKDAGGFLAFPQIDLISSAYSYNLGAGQTSTSPLLTKTGTSSDMYTLPAILAEFTGAGNINLTASTFTQTLLSNSGGNTFAAQVSLASANGNIIYTYEPIAVPEPGTALFGIACVGIAAFRRRRTA